MHEITEVRMKSSKKAKKKKKKKDYVKLIH